MGSSTDDDGSGSDEDDDHERGQEGEIREGADDDEDNDDESDSSEEDSIAVGPSITVGQMIAKMKETSVDTSAHVPKVLLMCGKFSLPSFSTCHRLGLHSSFEIHSLQIRVDKNVL